MITDIRDRPSLSGEELTGLNFINASGGYVFRKFYRAGLRSHIFEVLSKADIDTETRGCTVDGIRMFPRAIPLKMFRILRRRFNSKEEVFDEINKYNLLLSFLGPECIATSDELMVDYTGTGRHQIVLCGLQEYVNGEILDPWRITGPDHLSDMYTALKIDQIPRNRWVAGAMHNISGFIDKIKNMIKESSYIPDLAGIGNLILTPDAGIKLVDINNIVHIMLDREIRVDDKGYPSCDVSVQVLYILETEILKKTIPPDDPLYQLFLAPERKEQVRQMEKAFYMNL